MIAYDFEIDGDVMTVCFDFSSYDASLMMSRDLEIDPDYRPCNRTLDREVHGVAESRTQGR